MSRTAGVIISALASAMMALVIVLVLGASPAPPPAPGAQQMSSPRPAVAPSAGASPLVAPEVRSQAAERLAADRVVVGVGAAVSGTPRP